MKNIMMIVAVLGLTMLTGCGHTHSHTHSTKDCKHCATHSGKSGCTDCGDKGASATCPDCKTASLK